MLCVMFGLVSDQHTDHITLHGHCQGYQNNRLFTCDCSRSMCCALTDWDYTSNVTDSVRQCLQKDYTSNVTDSVRQCQTVGQHYECHKQCRQCQTVYTVGQHYECHRQCLQ